MVEIKKLERIKDGDNPNKIEKKLNTRFNLSSGFSEPNNYKNKVSKIIPKLAFHDNSKDNVNILIEKEGITKSEGQLKMQNPSIDGKSKQESQIKSDNEKKRAETISNNLQNTNDMIISNSLQNITDKDSQSVDNLLDALNKHLEKVEEEQPFIESISFLDEKPKIMKVPITDHGVSHLYAKIDEVENKVNKAKVIQTEYINQNQKSTPINKQKEISALIEEIEIPEIISIRDDTNISQAISKGFSSQEHVPLHKKEHEQQFVLDNGQIKSNPHIEIKIKNHKTKNHNKSKKQRESKEDYRNIMINPPAKDSIIEQGSLIIKNTTSHKPAFDYILPIDSESNTTINEKISLTQITNKEEYKKPELVYNIKPKIANIDKTHLSEKYSIDEFTFVNITYTVNQGLVYNIVQPKLNQSQEEMYLEIKKLFLDSIDSNYLSFKGDKQTINNYIQEIFDLTIDKLPYSLNDLEKKLFLSFIKRDFSGFGMLSSVLEDENIIEISCAGENLPVIAYHLMYGGLETNLKFESIFKLNQYVLSLCKIMGLQVNSAQPMINGYLPNGYKVEGLYSIGDTSNKGSSFIIKKYLENPLTPVSLINLGIGTNDVYSYIWTAMDQRYQVVIVGGDSAILLSALAQFYPDKKITSVQSFDYIKLPQKNWIKKLITENTTINKKAVISQVISQRSDYLILDNFSADLFDTKWYDISLLYIQKDLLEKYLEKAKVINLNLIIINLERIKINSIDQMQITRITELYNGNEYDIVKYSDNVAEFHINLVSSNINLLEYTNHKKLLRWLIDSDIKDGLDFNNIINDYYQNKEYLFKKLNIAED